MSDIDLGFYVDNTALESEPDIAVASRLLAAHRDKPWFRFWLAQHLGLPAQRLNRRGRRSLARVESRAFGKHALVCGSTGSGKSRAVIAAFFQHLKLGLSAVVIEPKYSSVQSYVAWAGAAGLSPGQVTVISPRVNSVPGFNPFLSGLPVVQTAADLADLVIGISASSGPRMMNICQHLFIVIGVHRLSLFEAVRFLQRPDFQERLLRRPVPPDTGPSDVLAYHEASQFFLHELAAMGKSERGQAVAPILTRLAEVMRSWFLQALLCSDANTVSLDSLWRRQQVIVIHLDAAALGNTGAKLLAGFFASLLFRTAMRASGTVGVLFILDELATAEQFIGKALVDILTVARSQGLRLLVACQLLDQLSDALRRSLLSQTAVQLFFRLGFEDARTVAASLSAGAEETLKRVIVSLDDKKAGGWKRAVVRHPILDPSGQQVRLAPQAWGEFCRADLFSADSLTSLYRLAHRSRISRLYVHDPNNGAPVELRRYVQGVAAAEIYVDGPSPLALAVTFPTPKLTGVEKRSEHDGQQAWIKRLQELEVQHAVLRTAGQEPGVIRLAEVPNIAFGPVEQRYLEESLRSNGRPPETILAALAARRQAVDGEVPLPDAGGGADDGSIY